jgi:nucleoside-diphosphate-sugar epimerase
MRVLVSGAGGFLGRHVIDRLYERGHDVRAIIRPGSQEPTWRGRVEAFRADLRVHDNLISAFDSIDAVIHLAAATSGTEDLQFASTVVATERFLEAMTKSSVKRLVHVSSLVVYDWARAKTVIDEQTPLLENPYDMGPYTIAKIWQERIISRYAKSNSWKLTILRPGFIWGAGHTEIAGMGRRLGKRYIMFGPFTRLPLCHVINCAHCLVTAAETPESANTALNVIDGDEIRVWRYVREYARRSGGGGIMVPVPYRMGLGIAYLASFTSRTLFGKKGKLPSLLTPRRFESQFKPIRFSNCKVTEVLKWDPVNFNECLKLSFPSPMHSSAPQGTGD